MEMIADTNSLSAGLYETKMFIARGIGVGYGATFDRLLLPAAAQAPLAGECRGDGLVNPDTNGSCRQLPRHGWVYGLKDGLVRDLLATVTGHDQAFERCRAALAAL